MKENIALRIANIALIVVTVSAKRIILMPNSEYSISSMVASKAVSFNANSRLSSVVTNQISLLSGVPRDDIVVLKPVSSFDFSHAISPSDKTSDKMKNILFKFFISCFIMLFQIVLLMNNR